MGETHEKLDGGLQSPSNELAEARSTLQNSSIDKNMPDMVGTNNSMDYEQMIEENRQMELILNDLTRHGDIQAYTSHASPMEVVPQGSETGLPSVGQSNMFKYDRQFEIALAV